MHRVALSHSVQGLDEHRAEVRGLVVEQLDLRPGYKTIKADELGVRALDHKSARFKNEVSSL